MARLSFLVFILTFNISVCQDYDFEDIDLAEMEEVWKEEGEILMTWTEAIEMMKLEEVENYKVTIEQKENKIQELEWEKQTMFETWEEDKKEKDKMCDKEKSELKSEHEAKLNEFSGKLKNKSILIRFLSTLLQKNEKQYKVSRDVIKKQSEKLKFLVEENKNYQDKEKLYLRQADLQAEVILSQERQKEELKDIIKIEETLKEEFQNLTKLNTANSANYPVYVQVMAKTIDDQMEDFNKLR